MLATGGRSLPKTGSDGFGYELATAWGTDTSTRHRRSRLSFSTAIAIRVGGRLTRGGAELRVDGTIADTARGLAAVDALRCQWSCRVEHVAPLASCAACRGAPCDVLLNVCPSGNVRIARATGCCHRSARARGRSYPLSSQASIPASVADAWIGCERNRSSDDAGAPGEDRSPSNCCTRCSRRRFR